MVTTPARCPDCQADQPTSLGRLPDVDCFAGRPLVPAQSGGELLACGHCGLRFRFPVPDLQVNNARYDNGMITAWSGALRPDQRIVLEHLAAREGGGSVLDFGCYTGELLRRLPPAFERHGVEINEAAAEQARRAGGATVWSDLDAIPAGRRFDVVICMDVVEHFPSPRELLGRLLERVRPGGVLLVTTGDAEAPLWRRLGARWWYCSYGEHIAFISGHWLRHHGDRLGVSVERCERFNYKDESVFVRLARWMHLGSVLALDRARLALARLIHGVRPGPAISPSPVPSGLPGVGLSRDHLFIVLQKKGEPLRRETGFI